MHPSNRNQAKPVPPLQLLTFLLLLVELRLDEQPPEDGALFRQELRNAKYTLDRWIENIHLAKQRSISKYYKVTRLFMAEITRQ